MANVVTFTVNDTSPAILYSPLADTLATPNLSASWNPYYSLSGYATELGVVGNGTSLHITSDNGSSLLVQWHGTGIQLYGNATRASYSITLDGAPFSPAASSISNLLVSITGLPDVPHAVILTALIPETQTPPNSSIVVFENAVLTSSPAPLNVSFSTQTIDDNSIAFLGRWSFNTAPTGASFHYSQTLGDRLVTSFNGTTFLLHGMTSPTSGKYTVTVDNVTTTLSARSSFTAYDSLLFYATGLDSASTHYVQVSNSDGGNLSLLVGGFNTFAPYSTLTSPPLQKTTSVSNGFPKGTIAAIVLAGILAILIFSSLIFYFFFYRPRRERRRYLAERENWSSKEHEAGVIDIGPEVDKRTEVGSPMERDRESVGNGFSRWKRGAVDGSPGELSLPIRFRRSNSLDEKFATPMNEVPFEELSDPGTNSSAMRKERSKSKGKARQITGSSWLPGRLFDINRSRREQHLSANTAVSTFIAAEPPTPKNLTPKNAAPPSYAASVSIRDSRSTTNGNPTKSPSNRSMPSVPHSVSLFPDDQDRSYPPQKQDITGAILLPQGELNSEQDSSADSSPHRLKLPQAIPTNSLPRVDRGGGVEDNVDDTLPVSLQQAIRSFSPRPVRHPYANQDEDSIQTPSPRNDKFPDDAALTMLPESPSNSDDLVEVRDGVFLGVSPSSPFQVTFDHLPATSVNSGELSYVSTPTDSKPAGNSPSSSEPPNPDHGTGPTQTSSDFLQGPSNMRFRLTPLTIPPTVAVDPPSKSSNGGDSEGVMSFLDFSSREGSLASRSAWSEDRHRSNLDPPVELKSRWSNTTVPSLKSKSSHHGNINSGASENDTSDSSNKITGPQSVHSSTYPIPIRVSIPSSSDHSIMSARPSRISGLTTGDTLHIHPPFESLESPTESTSIPLSAVSELHFRQSVSEDNIGFNSRRTTESSLVFVSSSHPPPLPTRPDEIMSRPFDPSILVNRVLGLSSHPTMIARAASDTATTATPPISSLSPFVSPHTLRPITDTRGDRSQNSGTDSLGP